MPHGLCNFLFLFSSALLLLFLFAAHCTHTRCASPKLPEFHRFLAVGVLVEFLPNQPIAKSKANNEIHGQKKRTSTRRKTL